MSRIVNINGGEGFRARVGQEFGVSDWYDVTQAEINAFAAATAVFMYFDSVSVIAKDAAT